VKTFILPCGKYIQDSNYAKLYQNRLGFVAAWQNVLKCFWFAITVYSVYRSEAV